MTIGSRARVASSLGAATLAALAGIACQRTNRESAPASIEPAAATSAKTYGAPLASAKPMPIAELLDKPDGFVSHPVTVEGEVRKACTRRGCWMELASGQQPGTPGCRVTFKDYGFFVPIDSAGSRARVQGQIEIGVLPAASVRHYEEEGAVFAAKQPDGSAREVRLVATGVELWRGPR